MERYTATNAWGGSHDWNRNSFMWGLKVCQYSLLLLVPLPWTLKPAGIILVPTVPLKHTGFLTYLIQTVANVVTEQEEKKNFFGLLLANHHWCRIFQCEEYRKHKIHLEEKDNFKSDISYCLCGHKTILTAAFQCTSSQQTMFFLFTGRRQLLCNDFFCDKFPSVKCCDSCTSLSRSFWFRHDLAEETSPALTQSFTL